MEKKLELFKLFPKNSLSSFTYTLHSLVFPVEGQMGLPSSWRGHMAAEFEDEFVRRPYDAIAGVAPQLPLTPRCGPPLLFSEPRQTRQNAVRPYFGQILFGLIFNSGNGHVVCCLCIFSGDAKTPLWEAITLPLSAHPKVLFLNRIHVPYNGKVMTSLGLTSQNGIQMRLTMFSQHLFPTSSFLPGWTTFFSSHTLQKFSPSDLTCLMWTICLKVPKLRFD